MTKLPGLTLALLLALCAFAARAEVVNRILATIDGEPVTQYELERFIDRNVRARQMPVTERSVLLDALITDRIIQKEVVAQGIVIRDDDVDRYIANIRERNNLSEDQLREALRQQGLTMEAYRAQIREDLQKVQLINREIRGKVNVSPEEVQRYYDAHRDEYATPGGTTVSHILLRLPPNASDEEVLRKKEQARQLRAQLVEGADFAAMAREYSEDASAKDGGRLGTFQPGEMMEEFEAALKGLEPGQISEPFRTSLGIHVARLDARSGGSHQPLDELADEIKQKLYSAALEERYSRWLTEDLRKRHHVEILP